MKKPNYELANHEAVYDFYSNYRPIKTLTKNAYRLLNKVMRPTVSYGELYREELDYLARRDTPLILALNHQSDRNDQWTSAAVAYNMLPQKVGDIGILVKSTFYTGELLDEMKVSRGKIIRPIAQRALTNFVNTMGSVPVYRPGDQSSEQHDMSMSATDELFDVLAERMHHGMPTAIYPEGTADTTDPTRINPIKGGIAHLALRSIDYNDTKPTVIVPIGISYPAYKHKVNRKGNESVQPAILKDAHAHVGEFYYVEPGSTVNEVRAETARVLQGAVTTAFETQNPTYS